MRIGRQFISQRVLDVILRRFALAPRIQIRAKPLALHAVYHACPA
jgi:hypothetical protein